VCLKYPTVINPVLDAVEAISQRCQDELTSTESLDDSVIRVSVSSLSCSLSLLVCVYIQYILHILLHVYIIHYRT